MRSGAGARHHAKAFEPVSYGAVRARVLEPQLRGRDPRPPGPQESAEVGRIVHRVHDRSTRAPEGVCGTADVVRYLVGRPGHVNLRQIVITSTAEV
jgi:hypothetical protein